MIRNIPLALKEHLGDLDSMFAVASHSGEPLIKSRDLDIQFLVIKTKKCEHGGVKIIRVNLIFSGAEADLIRRADHFAAFNSASRHPGGKAVWVMIATFFSLH